MNLDRSLNTKDIVGAQPKAYGRIRNGQQPLSPDQKNQQKLRNPLHFGYEQNEQVQHIKVQQNQMGRVGNYQRDAIDNLLSQSYVQGQENQQNSLNRNQTQSVPLNYKQQVKDKEDFQKNTANFYAGMTPSVTTRGKYFQTQKILDAHTRQIQNNPQLGQNIVDIKTKDYNQNYDKFYGVDPMQQTPLQFKPQQSAVASQNQQNLNNNYQKNFDKFYGVDPLQQTPLQFKRDRQQANQNQQQDFQKNFDKFYGVDPMQQTPIQYKRDRSLPKGISNQNQQQDFQKNYDKFYGVDPMQQTPLQFKRDRSPQQQQLQRSYQQSPHQSQQQQDMLIQNNSQLYNSNALLNQKPMNQQMRLDRVFVIADSDNAILEQVNKYLISRRVTEYELFCLPGSILRLNKSPQQIENLYNQFQFSNQVHNITQIYVFQSLNSRALKVIAQQDLDRNQVRSHCIEGLKQFKESILDNQFKIYPVKGLCLDVRGNAETIF